MTLAHPAAGDIFLYRLPDGRHVPCAASYVEGPWPPETLPSGVDQTDASVLVRAVYGSRRRFGDPVTPEERLTRLRLRGLDVPGVVVVWDGVPTAARVVAIRRAPGVLPEDLQQRLGLDRCPSDVPTYAWIAASWWASKLDGPPGLGLGSATPRRMLGNVLRARAAPANDSSFGVRRALFRDVLARTIGVGVKYRRESFLKTDYGPCGELANAGLVACLDLATLPLKTSMYVSSRRVFARLGERGESVVLWEDPAQKVDR